MYNIHQLSAGTEITQEVAPQNTAANVAGAGVDMQGWDGVKFDVNLGVFTGSATFLAYVQEDTQSNYATATNIVGALTSSITNANQNVAAVIDIFRPSKRYVRLQASPAVNGVFVSATATRYRHAGILPVTHAAQQTVFVDEN